MSRAPSPRSSTAVPGDPGTAHRCCCPPTHHGRGMQDQHCCLRRPDQIIQIWRQGRKRLPENIFLQPPVPSRDVDFCRQAADKTLGS
jgi:hypothetical protein